MNLERIAIGDDAPEMVNIMVEIPLGSRNKYEYDPDLGVLVRDRVLPGNIRFPADYGFIPSTAAEDGDPLDTILAAYDPAFPGCLVRGRVIGALEMVEAGDVERNIFAVPDDDPRFANVRNLQDLPEQNLRELEQFFTAFRRMEGDEEARVRGWLGAEEAREEIRRSAIADSDGS